MKRLPTGSGAQARNILLVAIVTTVLFMIVCVHDPEFFGGIDFTVIGFSAFLFAILIIVSALLRSRPHSPAKAYLWLALVVWWSLLVSAEVFYRQTPETKSLAGHFSGAAYGEAAFWFVALLVLLLISGPQYLRIQFSGCNKWLFTFALVCVVSSPFAPSPLYSLVWAFKLLLVVLLLLLVSPAIRDPNDIQAFFWSCFWGFLILTVIPVIRAFANPLGAFQGGRLWGDPDGLSLCAGTLVLLALTLNSLRKRVWLAGIGIFGATAMIMSGGKTGIVAGIASCTIFFVLQKHLAAGFGWLLKMLALSCIVFVSTPLSSYFTKYQKSGNLSTLTGRTALWRTMWPGIMAHPILGHGYLATRLLAGSEYVQRAFPAAHAHNGFMEVLYNNGLIGLFILCGIHFVIIRNLWRTTKCSPKRNIQLLAAGSWAIYIDLLINGLADASFGGHASAPFMLLLGLVVVSKALRQCAQPKAVRRGVLKFSPVNRPPILASGFNCSK